METAKMGENAANGVQVTYFVAECMEFLRYGEYMEDIPTIKEALEYYDKIPSDRLNAGKGIGIHIHDPNEREYTSEYQLLTWQTLDVDSLQMMYGKISSGYGSCKGTGCFRNGYYGSGHEGAAEKGGDCGGRCGAGKEDQ